MNLCVVGTGYVGLVTGASLADFGHQVVCVDVDAARVESLSRGEVPFFEPGLAEIVSRNIAATRLSFTTELGPAVGGSLVVFLAVGTPEGENGEADLSQVMRAAEQIGAAMDSYRVIVTKSTVPIGTGAAIRRVVEGSLRRRVRFDVVSNPEFLREGSAVNDFMRPDRIVIGADSEAAAAIMREIYRPLYLIETPMVLTTVESAEMIKYASNAFLAVKIGFINEIANLCEEVGADVHVVAKGMGLDKRIGPKFLHAGPGYGGSCFPKDTRALVALGAQHCVSQRIVASAIEANEAQRARILGKIVRALDGIPNATLAVLGLAFKPNTSDVREAPALFVCRELSASGVRIKAFDPVAMTEARRSLGEQPLVSYAENAYDAAADADALVILTEWNEFRSLDLDRLHAAMRRPTIIDARNVVEPGYAIEKGFDYIGVGRRTSAAAVAAA
jgi:UDPglucose 6-dehydrogenase